MIVTSEIARQIASGKRSMIRVPARSSQCRLKIGNVYVIQTARNQTTCHITLTAIDRRVIDDKPVWELRFKKGDHTDAPRFLAARPGPRNQDEDGNGDYTTNGARSLNGAEEVSSAIQTKYAQNGWERHCAVVGEQRRRLQLALAEIRKHPHPRTSVNAQLRDAERRINRIRPYEKEPK